MNKIDCVQFLELSLVPANAGLEMAKSRGSIVAVLGRDCAGETLQVSILLFFFLGGQATRDLKG